MCGLNFDTSGFLLGFERQTCSLSTKSTWSCLRRWRRTNYATWESTPSASAGGCSSPLPVIPPASVSHRRHFLYFFSNRAEQEDGVFWKCGPGCRASRRRRGVQGMIWMITFIILLFMITITLSVYLFSPIISFWLRNYWWLALFIYTITTHPTLAVFFFFPLLFSLFRVVIIFLLPFRLSFFCYWFGKVFFFALCACVRLFVRLPPPVLPLPPSTFAYLLLITVCLSFRNQHPLLAELAVYFDNLVYYWCLGERLGVTSLPSFPTSPRWLISLFYINISPSCLSHPYCGDVTSALLPHDLEPTFTLLPATSQHKPLLPRSGSLYSSATGIHAIFLPSSTPSELLPQLLVWIFPSSSSRFCVRHQHFSAVRFLLNLT